jgi:isopenicillin N synthase-like dioxygenase
MTSKYADAATQILDGGYARCHLLPADRLALDALRSAAAQFFAGDPEWKRQFAGDGYGYESYGARWGDPDTDNPGERDECERLDSWVAHPLPGADNMPMLEVALGQWREAVSLIAGDVLDAVGAHYGYQREWDFGPTSCLEVSCYGAPPGRELLIEKHTDGQLLTVLAPDGPGLEVSTGSGMIPVWGDPGEVVIFPGELMGAMTGGQIRPLTHQVRNWKVPGRLSIIYFTTPPFTGHVPAFAGAASGFAEEALNRCTAYGQRVPADLIP